MHCMKMYDKYILTSTKVYSPKLRHSHFKITVRWENCFPWTLFPMLNTKFIVKMAHILALPEIKLRSFHHQKHLWRIFTCVMLGNLLYKMIQQKSCSRLEVGYLDLMSLLSYADHQIETNYEGLEVNTKT